MIMDDLSREEWHRRYMASLDDAGIGSKSGRKDWQAAHELPESTSDWTVDTYRNAVALILEPVVEMFRRLCKEHEIDPDQFIKFIWKDGTWLRVRDYLAACDFLKVLPDVTDRILLGASRGLGSDVEG